MIHFYLYSLSLQMTKKMVCLVANDTIHTWWQKNNVIVVKRERALKINGLALVFKYYLQITIALHEFWYVCHQNFLNYHLINVKIFFSYFLTLIFFRSSVWTGKSLKIIYSVTLLQWPSELKLTKIFCTSMGNYKLLCKRLALLLSGQYQHPHLLCNRRMTDYLFACDII